MNYSKYKALIFDLGGVIINLDMQRSYQQLAELLRLDYQKMLSQFHQANEPFDYETGHLNDADFRGWVRSHSSHTLTDQQIDTAWNAMILDLPVERIELLKKLSKNHRLFLLSNTNAIHIARVGEVLRKGKLEPLETVFEQVYYSHQMGLRKPDVAIFNRVIKENQLDPAKTLFLDDNADNIRGAEQAGLDTLHVTSPQIMLEYFDAG